MNVFFSREIDLDNSNSNLDAYKKYYRLKNYVKNLSLNLSSSKIPLKYLLS